MLFSKILEPGIFKDNSMFLCYCYDWFQSMAKNETLQWLVEWCTTLSGCHPFLFTLSVQSACCQVFV